LAQRARHPRVMKQQWQNYRERRRAAAFQSHESQATGIHKKNALAPKRDTICTQSCEFRPPDRIKAPAAVFSPLPGVNKRERNEGTNDCWLLVIPLRRAPCQRLITDLCGLNSKIIQRSHLPGTVGGFKKFRRHLARMLIYLAACGVRYKLDLIWQHCECAQIICWCIVSECARRWVRFAYDAQRDQRSHYSLYVFAERVSAPHFRRIN